MAAKKPAKKFVRKTEKQIAMVSFTLPEIYGDAEFVLPDTDQMPIRAQRMIRRNDANGLIEFLQDAGIDAETIDAIDSLDTEEFLELAKAWGEASGIDLPKSSA